MNGEESIAKGLIDKCKLDKSLKLSQVPVFVGWVPTRNIFTSFRKFQDQVEQRIGSLENKVDSMERQLTNIEQLLQVVATKVLKD